MDSRERPKIGGRCSFDAFIDKHALTDPALHELALIVRGADCGAPHLAPKAARLPAISKGLLLNFAEAGTDTLPPEASLKPKVGNGERVLSQSRFGPTGALRYPPLACRNMEGLLRVEIAH